ncbi:MAG: D-alanine--poly(phosphoribitol) ligase [Desulfobulbaceae bacterium]|nr:D-alanine--poly(phosphoribitol) ligase [Desulfobulbaceae bacterium]
MNWNPTQPFFEQMIRTPNRLALYADGVELSYVELAQQVCRLAAGLRDFGISHGSRVGILGSRSSIAIQAVLGTTWRGAAYVPLSTRWPEERVHAVLNKTALDALIVDTDGMALLSPQLAGAVPLLVIPGHQNHGEDIASASHSTLFLDSLPSDMDITRPNHMAHNDLTYIIFTSGTTGVPKGVMVACASVKAYLEALAARKAMTPEDRASQFTELSFDPSIGEIYVPLYAGASLHVLPAVSHASPARFIRERQLTVWGSAPAAITWMRDTRSLQPGSLTGLRYSSFGGEPLPLTSVLAWQQAAPNSVIDNLYGPTEATVDCAGQRVEPGATPLVTPGRKILAIGTPHPGSELAVFSADRRILPDGEHGELGIAGRQLSLGYLEAPELTAERFPILKGKRWYLTGDIGMRDESGLIHHLGRIDNQIKIHGYRVELEDIEAHMRLVADTSGVAAVAWPVEEGVARAIIGFVANSSSPAIQIREALRDRLPAHMVPQVIHELPSLPLNSTGKLDRQALVAQLEAETAQDNADSG